MTTVKKYLSLIKFAHTIFALPFAMIGFSLATMQLGHQWNLNDSIGWSSHPKKIYISWQDLIIKLGLVIFCMVTARSAAMAFNRYLDSHFDARNPRTAIREIPAGIISKGSALRFVMINCFLFVIATFFINRICFLVTV